MVTALLHLRVNKEIIKVLDEFVKNGFYNSRTEFINEALRKKIDEDKIRQIALENLKKNFGSMKGKIKRLTKEERVALLEKAIDNNPSDVLREFGLE